MLLLNQKNQNKQLQHYLIKYKVNDVEKHMIYSLYCCVVNQCISCIQSRCYVIRLSLLNWSGVDGNKDFLDGTGHPILAPLKTTKARHAGTAKQTLPQNHL